MEPKRKFDDLCRRVGRAEVQIEALRQPLFSLTATVALAAKTATGTEHAEALRAVDKAADNLENAFRQLEDAILDL